MTEILKGQFGLLAFKVKMDLAGREPRVACALQGTGDDSRVQALAQWSFKAEELGLPERLERRKTLYKGGYDFRLPASLREELASGLERANPEGRPLWLHIAKPTGFLNLVPWEQLLQPDLGIPILRLPDFLARPGRDLSSGLRVALCGSAPAAKSDFNVFDSLARLGVSILQGAPPATRIDIFTDAFSADDLEAQFAHQEIAQAAVSVHDPWEAADYEVTEATTRISGRAGRIANPWLLWMTDVLRGRTVDVVHFVGHGFLSGTKGSVALAESPVRNKDRQMARFIGAAELGAFLNRVGAWSVAFSGPEHNYSQMGLRLLADKLGLMRPGPVVHHDLAGDDDELTGISSAYRFLFSGSREAPVSPGLFLYCHPSYAEPEEELAEPGGGLLQSFIGRQSAAPTAAQAPKSWLSATDRYLEQRSLDAARAVALAEGRAGASSTAARRRKEAEETEAILNRIREALQEVAANERERAG